jgi:hypothetical protein
MRLKHRWVIVVLLCALTSVAQQSATGKTSDAGTIMPAATGTVTGRVYLDDTKGPARKAEVSLQPAAGLLADALEDRGHGQADGGVTIGIETSFDGSFSFSHVAPGTYYVIASYPGYVSPYVALSLAEARSPYGTQQPLGPAQEAAKELVLKSIPQVTVQSGQPASTDVTLERGGAISGNISYDDGNPAAGLEVTVLARMLREGKETWAPFKVPSGSPPNQVYTDDRGNYRVSGLPARTYLVEVMLGQMRSMTYTSSSGSSSSGSSSGNGLTVYSGSTPRLKNGASFALGLGEERTGEDIRIPMSKFHTITGNIVSAHDGHVINGGQVMLYSTDGKSIARYTNPTEDDAGFTLNFIYDGEYILSCSMAADVDYELRPQQPGSMLSPPQYDSHPRHFYGSASIPLHVDGDMDGVTIAVPEPTADEAQAYRNALQQQEQHNQSPQ